MFIIVRKVSLKLIKELEKLGYSYSMGELELPWLVVDNCALKYHTINDGCISKFPGINCGESEELFIALSSLRDDSDRFQWFTDDTLEIWKREGDLDYSGFHFQSNRRYHKATSNELINHFL